MLASEWYAARLEARAALDRRLWARHARDLRQFLNRRTRLQTSGREAMQSRLTAAEAALASLNHPDAASRYQGTIGVDPSLAPAEPSGT